MSRAKALRITLEWAQHELASFLSTSQTAVCRMEESGRERGPVVLLLNTLEDGVNRGAVTAGISPLEARDLLFPSPPNTEAAQ